MLLKLVSLLVIASQSFASFDTTSCPHCYSKAPTDFTSCIKATCASELLQQPPLSSASSQKSLHETCRSCMTQAKSQDCSEHSCDALLTSLAIELAVRNPFRLQKVSPIETTSCKTCLEIVSNSEQLPSCYYSACKEELNPTVLNKKAELTGSNCVLCSSYKNDEYRNCAFMFCREESKAVLIEMYGEIKASSKLCADVCYQRTIEAGTDFFECANELCGANVDIVQLYREAVGTETCKCDACYYLFSGVSLKSCFSAHCSGEVENFAGKTQLFSVHEESKSACSACSKLFKQEALSLCVIQECRKEFQALVFDKKEIQMSRCQNFCTYSYYDGYFTYNEWYDCYYYSCKNEIMNLYSSQLALKPKLSVYCQSCYTKYGTYGYYKLESECAYCYKESLLDKKNLFTDVRSTDLCSRCKDQDGSFFLMCVNSNCGDQLLQQSRKVALYSPIKARQCYTCFEVYDDWGHYLGTVCGYLYCKYETVDKINFLTHGPIQSRQCYSCESVYDYSGKYVGQSCGYRNCKHETGDKMISLKQATVSESCKACEQYEGEVFNDCVNWYCRKELDAELKILTTDQCAGHFFEFHSNDKEKFIEAALKNCLISEDEANFFVINKLTDGKGLETLKTKLDSLENIENYIKDTPFSGCKDYFKGGLDAQVWTIGYCKAEINELSSELMSKNVQKTCNECVEYQDKDLKLDCIMVNCKTEVMNKLHTKDSNPLKDGKVKLTHCDQCDKLYSEGYYTSTERDYCRSWYCRSEINQEIEIYQNQKEQNGRVTVTLAGFAFAASLVAGMAFVAFKRRQEGELDYRVLG